MKNEKLKDFYSAVQIEVISLRDEDVIATSLLDPDGSGEGGNLGNWTPPEW